MRSLLAAIPAAALWFSAGAALVSLPSTHAQASDLHTAASAGDLDRIKELLAAGSDIEAKIDGGYYDGFTPLHAAAVVGKVEAVKMLLAAGADAKAKSGNGLTPLH